MGVTMISILKIGMDVHSKSYTICVVEPKIGEEPELIHAEETKPNIFFLKKYFALYKRFFKILLCALSRYDIIKGDEPDPNIADRKIGSGPCI